MSENLLHFSVNANEKSIRKKYLEVHWHFNCVSPQIMNDISNLEKIPNLRNFHLFGSQNSGTKRYGLDCIA